MTTEGDNTFSKSSDFGQHVVSLTCGDVFGELGLLCDQPRAATIRCETDCWLLVIQRTDFQKMFGGEITDRTRERLMFFQKHVPAFTECFGGTSVMKIAVDEQGRKIIQVQPNPSDLFSDVDAVEGHNFFVEGQIAEPSIIFIHKGKVELLSNRIQFPLGVYVRADVPQSHAFESVFMGELHAGDILCSLGALGFPTHEPFTAQVVSEKCHAYTLIGAEKISKLDRRILNAIRQHLVATRKMSLLQSSGFVSLQSLPGSSTWTDLMQPAPGSSARSREAAKASPRDSLKYPSLPPLDSARRGALPWEFLGTEPERFAMRLPEGDAPLALMEFDS